MSTLSNNNNNDKEASDLSEFTYTQETAILYSLGIGETHNLNYLYECAENFSIFPTYFILPSIKALIDYDVHQIELAKFNVPFDVTRLLHGEQFIEFYEQPKQISGKLITHKPHLVEILDKGSATMVITETNTFTSANKQLLCRNQVCCIIGNTGGWGGPRQASSSLVENIVKPPEGKLPDKVVEQQTVVNQAALYRLSGDRNPLHIDPIFAQAGGYSKPILHGLCTLGFAARHVLESFPGERLRRLKARFAGVIYPGETIVTEMWRENKRVHVHCKTKETGKNLIVGGYVDFF